MPAATAPTGRAPVRPPPPLAAVLNAEYFNDIMKGYADGKVYSTIMGRIAKGYTDEELALMADYFVKKPYDRPSRSSTKPW